MCIRDSVEVIRANGDPRISIAITSRDADRPDAPAQRSPVAENLLAERIKSFGFRTWTEGGAEAGKAPDFSIAGEARVRRLSTRLEASGLTVTKYALSSWTIKAVDRATGEVHIGRVPPYAVVVPGSLPGKPLPDGTPGPSLYCAVIVKTVDAQTRSKTGINELLRSTD